MNIQQNFTSHECAVYKAMADKHGKNSIYAIAGLFHDSLEDTPLMTISELKEEIRFYFPFISDDNLQAVVDVVWILTRNSSITYMNYIRSVSTNKIATEIKLADIDHNLRHRPTAPSESLIKRYTQAEQFLLDKQQKDKEEVVWSIIRVCLMLLCFAFGAAIVKLFI